MEKIDINENFIKKVLEKGDVEEMKNLIIGMNEDRLFIKRQLELAEEALITKKGETEDEYSNL